MEEPVAIPIRDLDDQTGSSDHDDTARSTAAERLTELLVDAITSGAGAVISSIEDAGDEELRDVAAASAGFAIEAVRAIGQLAAAVESGLAGPASATARSPLVGDLLAHWAAVWRQASEDQPTAGETAQRALDRVLGMLDLTALIRSHVDVQAIAADVDVNGLLDDLDVDGLAARIDMAALTRRIDVDGLASRIDVDALARRIDLDALIARLDLARLASDVIEELDLADLVRDAAAETTSEGVRVVRLRGVGADRAIRRAVDRVLSRRDGGEAS
jgi:hypothetical protein